MAPTMARGISRGFQFSTQKQPLMIGVGTDYNLQLILDLSQKGRERYNLQLMPRIKKEERTTEKKKPIMKKI